MGVKGLWKLLRALWPAHPCRNAREHDARRSTSSIWMTQFVKAMRDEEGDPSKTPTSSARCGASPSSCYHGVRPVIVFDGGVACSEGAAHPPAAHAPRAPRGRRAVDGERAPRRAAPRRGVAAESRPRKMRRRPTRAASTRGARARPHLRGRRRRAPRPRNRHQNRRRTTTTTAASGSARRDRGRLRGGGRRRRELPSTSRRSSPCRPPCARRASRPSTASSARARRRLMPVAGDADEFSATQLSSFPAGRDVPAARRAGPGRAGRRRRARRAHPLRSQRRSCCCATMKTVSRSGAASGRAWSGSCRRTTRRPGRWNMG